jgi:hypothetical protein
MRSFGQIDVNDDLRRAILAALGPRPTPVKRRQIAEHLRQLADEQDRLAAAEERSGHRVRQARTAGEPGRTGGRPRGSGGRFLRFEEPTHRKSGTLHVAAALWHALGDPARLDIQRAGSRLVLRPAEWPAGYAVTLPTGARGGNPRMRIGAEAANALGLVEGRIGAEVQGGAIVAER